MGKMVYKTNRYYEVEIFFEYMDYFPTDAQKIKQKDTLDTKEKEEGQGTRKQLRNKTSLHCNPFYLGSFWIQISHIGINETIWGLVGFF